MAIKDVEKIDQPREKLVKYGATRLRDEELLALLLRTGPPGTNVLELSRQILKRYRGVSLANTTVDNLMAVRGLAQAKACEIVACFELGRRFLKDKKSTLLLTPREVWEELRATRGSKKEHFAVFFLDTQNQVIKSEVISVGTVNSSLTHPREVFEPAVRHLASHIIIAHNHPSGSLEPSDQDLSMTKHLCEAGKLLGIEVLDHIIVTANGYSSLKERNFL